MRKLPKETKPEYIIAIREAVEQSGKPLSQIAREIGENQSSLHKLLYGGETPRKILAVQKLLDKFNLRLVKNRKAKSAKPRGE